MSKTSNKTKRGARNAKLTVWRRLALAIPVSIVLHLVLLLLMRPSYRDVADFPVEMEITGGATHPPAGDPSQKEGEKDPEPEAEAPKAAPPPADPRPGPSNTAPSMPESSGAPDGGVTDGGTGESQGNAQSGHPKGKGDQKGGICFHNLFPFSQQKTSWIFWLSMASLRNTSLEKHLVATLESFSLGRNMAQATGIEPESDVQGLLVSTQNIMDPRAFRVVLSYDSGEITLRRKLARKHGENPSFAWAQTTHGYEAWLAGSHRWHLVGSGRVLVITSPQDHHSQLTPDGTGAGKNSLAANSVPENPFSTGSTSDAGPANNRPVQRGSFPNWPQQITCLSAGTKKDLPEKPPAKTDPVPQQLDKIAKGYLTPDSTGRWPVALLATSDPRSLGVGSRNLGQGVTLEFIRLRGFFSNPIRIEGEIFLKGNPERIKTLAAIWKNMAIQSTRDPFLAMAGLAHLFDKLQMATTEDRIVFSVELTESQIRAALIFLQLQGEIMNRRSR